MKTNDPAHYRKMSEPFETVDAANDALLKFFEDVKVARDKHRIADVVVLCEIHHVLDGQEVRGSASSQFGSSANELPMLATAYGAAQARHQDMLALLSAGGRRKVKTP